MAFGIASLCIPSVMSLPSGPFDGAEWISVHSDSLPVYPDYLSVFRLGFNLDSKPGDAVSVFFGLDDPRLMDADKNVYVLSNAPGESYMRLSVEGDSIKLYRSGYHPQDNPLKAVAVFPVDNFSHSADSIEIAVNYGHLDVFVNGRKVGYKGANPLGNGGDYISFPVLGKVAVDIPFGSGAKVSDVTVSNFRDPRNAIARLSVNDEGLTRMEMPVRSMPEMRSVITVNPRKKVKKATANATAMGIYDLYVDGNRINEEYFLPGSTQYNKTHLYHEFDLTDRLKPGDNEIRVRLGEGWWSGPSTYMGEYWNFFGDRQAFLAEITVEYMDGSSDRFVTSPETWEYSVDGPIVTGSFFQGEIFDARRDDMNRQASMPAEKRIWRKTVKLPFDEMAAPVAGGWSDFRLRPSFGDRVLAVDTLTAVSMTEPRPGVYVYDMGQNMAAVPYLEFNGLDRGQEVTLRHGEVLYPDMPQYASNAGMVMTENLRAAMCTDKYIASGDGVEKFSPRHTLHGYRYLELTGIDAPLQLEAVKSIPVSSVHGFKAHFECSDSLINRLWENVKWSTMSNFVSIPTDCPQRNERLGWMGDISVFSPTATKIADVSPLLRQYLQSVRDCQAENGKFPDVAPAGVGFGGFLWGSAGITVPWEYYRQYGDTALLAEHYPAMKKYMDHILGETIEPSTGVLVQNREWGDLGDWLSPEYERNDKSLLWECYLIYDLEIMRDVANLLGMAEDAGRYQDLIDERKRFFAETYVDPATQKTRWSAFDPGRVGQPVDTQSSYALPLAMGIYDTPKFRENFVVAIERENHADDGTVCPPYSLMTGFIGTAWIMEALSRIDRDDVAYSLLTSTNYPSWLYPVTQGATTVWERLNSYTEKDGFGSNNSMNSFNHYSFGSVANWLLTRCLGISRDAEGNVTVDPTPDPTGKVKWARGWIDTPEGRVESSWEERYDNPAETPYVDAPAWGDLGDGTFANPVLNADYSDPDIVRIGDRYYLTCSEFHFMGMPVLESEDLVNWKIVGQIFDSIDLPGYSDMTKYAEGTWAPALKEHDGKFWMYVCTPEEGLFMSRADSPAGPWEPLHMVKGIAKWEDPCPFWDEDGQAYLVRSRHRAGPIIVHRMSSDGRELLDDGVTVYEGPVAEGPKMFKKDGWYYISIPEGGVGEGWQTILRSRDIYGPYESKRVLEQGSTDVNGPHQGSLVETPEGDWWFAHFQSAGARGRVMHLQPVKWVDGWPEIGTDYDGNGVGEPMAIVPMPFGKSAKAFTPQTSDEFDGDSLGIQWQFNHNPDKERFSVSDGILTLRPLKASRLRDARNQLTQKMMGYKSKAAVSIDLRGMKGGDRSGLLCIGKKFMGAGIAVESHCGKDVPVVYMEEDSLIVFSKPLDELKPDVPVIICLDLDAKENRYAYSYSVDGGKTFEPLGESFEMRDGFWKGVRTGLYAYTLGDTPGETRFDWFRYRHDGPPDSCALHP